MHYKPATFPCEWIRVHLERVAMCEHQIALHGSGANASIKALDTALNYIIQCREALVALIDKGVKNNIAKGREIASGERREMKSVNVTNKVTSQKDVKAVIGKGEEKIEKTKEKGNAPRKESQEKDFTSKEEQLARGDQEEIAEHAIKEMKIKDNASLETERKIKEHENKLSIKNLSADEGSTETNNLHKNIKEVDQSSQNTEGGEETEKDTELGIDKHELTQVENTTFDERLFQELKVLIPILETRLTFVLKEMVKVRSTKKATSKNKELSAVELEKVKLMYSLALRGCAGDNQQDIFNKLKRITDVLAQIKLTA